MRRVRDDIQAEAHPYLKLYDLRPTHSQQQLQSLSRFNNLHALDAVASATQRCGFVSETYISLTTWLFQCFRVKDRNLNLRSFSFLANLATRAQKIDWELSPPESTIALHR